MLVGVCGARLKAVHREGYQRVSEACDVEFRATLANDAKFLEWFVHREPFR